MNLSEARALVRQTIGRTDKDDLIDSAINLGLQKVSAQRLWSELLTEASVTSVSGTQTVDLGAAAKRVVGIKIIDSTSSYPLTIRSKDWIDRMFSNPSANSNTKPTFGYLIGTTLYLVGIPDDAYEIRYTYYRVHPALSANTDEILLTLCDGPIVSYATYWLFKSLQQHTDAREWYADYNIEVQDAKRLDAANYVTLQIATPNNIQGMYIPADFVNDPFVHDTPE